VHRFCKSFGRQGQTFEKIGFVKGNGTTNVQKSYNFTDNAPLSGGSSLNSNLSYYRLRQVDFDGSSVTSNVISIAPKSPKGTLKVYPNPTSDNQITLELGENMARRDIPNTFGTEEVSVINSLGQTVFQQKTLGQNNLQLNVSTWAKGVYFIKAAGETVKFVKN
jgi:hypothetical protein